MNIVCSKQELSEAANHISRVVSSKSPLPALTGLLIVAKDNRLKITGYDLEMGMITEIPATVSDSGKIVLDARLFCDIVRRLPEDVVNMSVDERNVCKISCGKALFSLVGINADEYPEMPTVDNAQSVTLPSEMLQSMVRQTIFSVADVNGPKPILSGIHYEIGNGRIRLVACDGYRISIRTETINSDCEMNFTVPSKAMSEVIKLISDGNDIVISASNRHIIFNVDGYEVISRLLDGEFFDYKRAIPADFTSSITGTTADMTEMIERISQVIVERLKTPIICSFENSIFHASCLTELGNAQDEMDVDMTGENVKIGFNSKYLSEALRASETDKVKINIGSPLSPISITPIDGDSFLFIIMPVKIR